MQSISAEILRKQRYEGKTTLTVRGRIRKKFSIMDIRKLRGSILKTEQMR